jgi:hypothetical protein
MIAKEVKNLLGILCSERMNLDDQLFPFKASVYYNQVREGGREGGRERHEDTLPPFLHISLQAHANKTKQKSSKVAAPPANPGEESYRRRRESTVK